MRIHQYRGRGASSDGDYVPDEAQLEHGGDHLEQRGQTPAPVALHVKGAQGDTCGEDGPGVPRLVEEATDDGTFLGVAELREQLRRTGDGE